MKKSIIILISLILLSIFPGCSHPDAPDDCGIATDNHPKELEFRPRTKENPIKHPRKPAACSVSGYFSKDEIYLFSKVAAVAEIYIYSNSDEITYFDYADLSSGFSINISDLKEGVYIKIILNEIEFIAEF